MNVENNRADIVQKVTSKLPAFYVEVIFDSQKRQTVPSNGYRPHIVLQKDPTRTYLGVFFTGMNGAEKFDKSLLLQINGMYEGVDYSQIVINDQFWVMEGSSIVATGTILGNALWENFVMPSTY